MSKWESCEWHTSSILWNRCHSQITPDGFTHSVSPASIFFAATETRRMNAIRNSVLPIYSPIDFNVEPLPRCATKLGQLANRRRRAIAEGSSGYNGGNPNVPR
jgi:hypothetical protein